MAAVVMSSVAVPATCGLKGEREGVASQQSGFRGFGRRELNSSVARPASGAVSSRSQVRMANPHEGKGVFAPIVVVVRKAIGAKQFNQLRGKGIALHSQVITEFCKSVGADAKQRQGLIRLAKKNGEKLGFLA